jgi:hypothetical protein
MQRLDLLLLELRTTCLASMQLTQIVKGLTEAPGVAAKTLPDCIVKQVGDRVLTIRDLASWARYQGYTVN